MPAFLDTNILLYAVSTAPKELKKSQVARQLLAQEDWLLSTQVLQEFYVNAVRKLAQPLSDKAALSFIEQLTHKDPLPVDLAVVLRGIHNAKRHQISYWDGAIVAAAQLANCDFLYSEDLNHGQCYENLKVLNPFKS